MDKTVTGDRNHELKGVTYHSGSPTSGHYTGTVNFKERWRNCNDDKTVTGDRNHELKGVTYHSGSPTSGHYTGTVNFKGRWRNCNDAVVKSME